jgi:hypothetical protein
MKFFTKIIILGKLGIMAPFFWSLHQKEKNIPYLLVKVNNYLGVLF